MGNETCSMTDKAAQLKAETVFTSVDPLDPKGRQICSKPQRNINHDEGLNPLITTFRGIAEKYRGANRSKTPSPQKRTTYKSPTRPPIIAELQTIRKKASPQKRTANQLNQHVDGLLRKGKESKLKLQIKRREKDFVEGTKHRYLERSQFQPNVHHRSSLKMEDFLRGQEVFQQRKKASLERSRQQLNNQLSESHTYKPSINVKSKRIVEEKRSKETPVDKLNRTEPDGDEACELRGSASPIKLRTIVLDGPQFSRRCRRLTRQRIDSANSIGMSRKFAGSSGRSTQNHLANKLIKEFSAALQTLSRTDHQKLSYLEFCEVLRLMGMVSRESDCNSFLQAQQRALLSQAYSIIGEASAPVECYSVLSLVMAVFGIDLYGHFSKVCLDCLKLPSVLSRSIELNEGSPAKPTNSQIATSASKELQESASKEKYFGTPSKQQPQTFQSVPSAMKPDECEETANQPLENLLVDSRLNRSLRELMRSRSQLERLGQRTKYFVRFREDQIAQLQCRLKPFYNTKMSQVKGYSEILTPLAKMSLDRSSERSNSRSSKKSLVNTNALSANHKNKIIQEAVKHSLVHPTAKLNTFEVLHLEKLVVEKENQEKKAGLESKQLVECTFKPRTNNPGSGKEPMLRHLYLHQLGKERVMYRTDRRPQEDTEGCSFQPDLTLTRNFKPSTKTIRLGDTKNAGSSSGDSQRKRIMRTNNTENPYQRMQSCSQISLEIRVDLGSQQKTIYVERGDNPDDLSKAFLNEHGLPSVLQARLAEIIKDGMQRAEATSKNP